MRFYPKSVFILRPNSPGIWSIRRGKLRKSFVGLYRAVQAVYTIGMVGMDFKEEIYKIEISIFRKK